MAGEGSRRRVEKQRPWAPHTKVLGSSSSKPRALSGTEGSLRQAHTTEGAAQAKQGTDL